MTAYRPASGHPPAEQVWTGILTAYTYGLATQFHADNQSEHDTYVFRYRFDYDAGPLDTAHMAEISVGMANNAAIHEADGPPVDRRERTPLGAHAGRLAHLVRTADPNGDAVPHWPPYDKSLRQAMVLNTSPTVEPQLAKPIEPGFNT